MDHYIDGPAAIIYPASLSADQKLQLIQLWNQEYPEKLAYKNLSDFENYFGKLKQVRNILVIDNHDRILGWAYSFFRDDERWFAIILSVAIQGRGFGKSLIDQLKLNEEALNGWVIDHSSEKKLNGKNYVSPLEFYRKYDFQVLQNQRLELNEISAVKIKWIRNKNI